MITVKQHTEEYIQRCAKDSEAYRNLLKKFHNFLGLKGSDGIPMYTNEMIEKFIKKESESRVVSSIEAALMKVRLFWYMEWAVDEVS